MKYKRLEEIIEFNPTEVIKKGTLCKKIPMDKLGVFSKYISSYELEEYNGGMKFKNGDTLVARITPCLENGKTSKVSILDKDEIGFGSTEYIVMRSKKNISDEDFIYYLGISPEFRNIAIKSMTGTSGRQRVQLDVVRNAEMLLPEYNEQVKIGKILSKIDEKIQFNTRTNDNLYELSQELFKRWFVDFEFPNSDGLEYKSANGTFKEVNGEQIPVDWQIMRLDEVAECQNGNAFYKDGYDESGIMVVDLGNVNINGSFIYTNADKYISQERLQYNPKYSKYGLYKNDLVMVMTDRKATMDLLGKTGKIYENKQYLLNQRMYRIRSKINVNYLYTVLNSSKILDELKSKALGSVQKYVNTGHINELKILVGTDEIMEKFSQIVNPIFERIENNILENDSLQKLRDTLLPKLMNGKIDLENVEI